MIYEAAGLTTVTTSGAATLGVVASATDDILIYELGVFLNAATASIFGLYRATVAGTASTTLTPSPAVNGAAAATGRVATAWSVQPTLAPVPHRTIGLPGAIGNGIVWTWQKGLHVPAAGAVILKNEAVTSAARFYVSYEE